VVDTHLSHAGSACSGEVRLYLDELPPHLVRLSARCRAADRPQPRRPPQDQSPVRRPGLRRLEAGVRAGHRRMAAVHGLPRA
jgi:hypothetical protein